MSRPAWLTPEERKASDRAATARWAAKNKERCLKKQREWYQKNKEHVATYSRARKAANPEKVNAAKRTWEKNNIERVRARERERGQREDRKQWTKEYHEKNRERINAHRRIYTKNLRGTVPAIRIKDALYSRISGLIRAARIGKKSAKTMKLIGCDVQFLMGYLEARFHPGMTWENYGLKGWHIDHHIPCAEFDLTIPDHQRQCFHYSNLRPLWAAANISKSAKRPPTHQAELI